MSILLRFLKLKCSFGSSIILSSFIELVFLTDQVRCNIQILGFIDISSNPVGSSYSVETTTSNQLVIEINSCSTLTFYINF